MAAQPMSGIYAIVNVVNGKRYVGSSLNFDNRWAKHLHALRRGKHHSRHLQNAFLKYGEAAFDFRIIEVCKREEMLLREQSHLDLRSEYNVCEVAGSPLGVKHSDESRRLMSARRKGVPHSKEHVAAQAASLRLKYQNDPDFRAKRSRVVRDSYTDELRGLRAKQSKERWSGAEYRRHMEGKLAASRATDDYRVKIKNAAKARWESPQYRERMRTALSGRTLSDDAKAKISKSLTGRKASVETRRKIGALTDEQVSRILRQRVDGRRYKDIAAEFGVSVVCIGRICKRKRYQWVDPEIPPMIDTSRRRKGISE